jgi:predicted  nucleic acid-binding Zn-ribbon protein
MDPHFCTKCGAKIPDEQPSACPQCGTATSTSSSAKNPVRAAALSLVIPGLGQAYNGNFLKGIGIFIVIVVPFLLSELIFHFPFGWLLLLLWAIGVYDAYWDAGRMKRGEIPEKKTPNGAFHSVCYRGSDSSISSLFHYYDRCNSIRAPRVAWLTSG